MLDMILGMALSAWAALGGVPLSAELSGANEVGLPGDPDGHGLMSMTANVGQEEICWELTVDEIAPPTSAHIHRGIAGTNGSVVVTLFPSTPQQLEGCVAAPHEVIQDIIVDPEEFYVNVHNAEFPSGAVRDQITVIGGCCN